MPTLKCLDCHWGHVWFGHTKSNNENILHITCKCFELSSYVLDPDTMNAINKSGVCLHNRFRWKQIVCEWCNKPILPEDEHVWTAIGFCHSICADARDKEIEVIMNWKQVD